MRESDRRICAEAIDRLEAALAAGPEVGHECVADAVRAVIALRNHVVAEFHGGTVPRDVLDRVNAVTSLAYGAEFPMMGVHLRRMEQTRDYLRELTASR